MISFIVIGRNEGWKLTKCFESIYKTIKQNTLSKYEIIYVDSKSSDDSIVRAKKFPEIKIFKLTSDTNAAIARNIGALEAKSDVFFFIDGDMEIIPNFLALVYSESKGLINDFVSGNWMNYYYESAKLISKSPYLNMKKDTIEKVTGGLFLINQSVWGKVGGMRDVFKMSEDIDLGLRLAKSNVFLHRKKEIAANHHTIAYLDKTRMWKDLFAFNHLYSSGLLYRSHVFNKHMYARLIRNDYTLLLLIGISLLVAFTHYFFLYIFYFLLVFIRGKNGLSRFAYLIIRDLSALLGFFFFWPKNEKKIEYIRIN
jgi:glycosyltransferase involved in cell wall biosynthesis